MNISPASKPVLLIASCLFFGFLSLYAFTLPDRLPEGDEAILLGVSDRIARFGFSWLPPSVNETNRFSSYGFFDNGFSKYGLGQSLLLIPVVKAFREAKIASDPEDYLVPALTVWFPGALTGSCINLLFFLIGLRLNYSVPACFMMTLVLGITTMIWPYTQTLFSDTTMGLCWLLALYGLLSYRQNERPFGLAISGASIGFAVLDKIVAAYAVPVFGTYFLWMIYKKWLIAEKRQTGKFIGTPLLWFAVPLGLMGFAVIWYNKLRYGSYWSLGYLDYGTYDIRDTIFGFNVPFLAGLYAQLLSSGKGFFFYNPSAILAFCGGKEFFQRNRDEGLFLFALIGGMILIYSTWYGWHGDWCWGLRYWSCLPPFFLLLTLPWAETFLDQVKILGRKILWKIAGVTVLFTISFAVQIPGLCIKSNDYILMAAQADIMKEKFYGKDWPIRDDSMQLHFIPEFSPLAGHWWMMRVIHNRQNSLFQEIFESPPWISLNKNWKPKQFDADRFRYNIWWMHILSSDTKGASGILRFAWFLGTFATGLFFLCFRMVFCTKTSENMS